MTLNKGVESEGEKSQEKLYTQKEVDARINELIEKRLAKDASSVPAPTGIDPKQIESIINTVAKALKKDENIDYQAGITEEQIPLEDYNEIGVQFCHPSCGWVITDDERKGQRVLIPYKKPYIMFNYNSELRHGYGKFETLTALSTYVSHSNKEIEWLRGHSLYNICFFENTNIASQQDVNKIHRLTEIMRTVSSLDLPALFRYCTENNVEKSNDIAAMRQKVAFAILGREENQSAKKAEERIMDALKTKQLLASDIGKD